MTTTFICLAIACLANAIGDVFMLYGIKFTRGRPGPEAMQKTPTAYIKWGALSGLLTVNAWFLLLPYISQINWLTGIAFATYVSTTLAFHVSYLFVGLGVQSTPELSKSLSKYLGWLTLCSFATALLVSVAWVADIYQRGGSAWLYLFATPTVTIIVVQMLLGRVLRRVPFYQVVSGPVAMLVFFAGVLVYTGWRL